MRLRRRFSVSSPTPQRKVALAVRMIPHVGISVYTSTVHLPPRGPESTSTHQREGVRPPSRPPPVGSVTAGRRKPTLSERCLVDGKRDEHNDVLEGYVALEIGRSVGYRERWRRR